jgi:hypothetical protein
MKDGSWLLDGIRFPDRDGASIWSLFLDRFPNLEGGKRARKRKRIGKRIGKRPTYRRTGRP